MRTWLVYKPAERATVMATDENWVFLRSAFLMGSRMTKPLSQNTGMETTQPMISMASCGCLRPTSRTTISASFSAAPVFSKIVPMRAPRMMTIPMLLKIPLKPEPMTPGMSFRGRPMTMARSRETPISARNGWTFHFEMARIMIAMAITNVMINAIPDMNNLLMVFIQYTTGMDKGKNYVVYPIPKKRMN